jgi:ribosomal protein S18 acetylase RimI-like enzyme
VESARPATLDDIADVLALARAGRSEQEGQRGGLLWSARDARSEPLDAALLALLDDPTAHVVTGAIDDVVVGYGIGLVELLRDGAVHGVVTDLHVDPEARGVGVGEAMLRLLVARLTASGATTIDAHALPGAREAKNFFEAQGFTARLIVMTHAVTGDWPDPEVPT